MMRKLSNVGVSLVAIAVTILIASGASALRQQKQAEMPEGKTSGQQHDRMDMSAMKGPHQLLAMAYRDNLVTFGKALHHEASQTKPINPEFSRAAVAEMKRSFDQMQEHHQEHMKTMDEKMKAQKADMMKQMEAHHSAVQEHLTALDKEVQTSAPAGKRISEHVSEILKQCDGMTKMHGATMDHKMAAPKEHKMN